LTRWRNEREKASLVGLVNRGALKLQRDALVFLKSAGRLINIEGFQIEGQPFQQ
jgi:hypothetical protein